jgi:hypothetical protein
MIVKTEIIIDQEIRISNFLREFSEVFPYLKIEVSKKGVDYSHDYRDFKLFEISTKRKPEGFKISGDMKVTELETIFWDKLGLQISVYRKTGSSMIETTLTNQWTLSHQNNKSKEIFFVN